MSVCLSEVRLVPVEAVCIHEGHEPARLDRTSRAILAENLLRHPVLATPMPDGRCLVLDGAHRSLALRALGCRRIPVQLVEPPSFTLQSWAHLVPAGAWVEELQRDPALRWAPGNDADRPVAELVDEEGTVRPIYARDSTGDLLAMLPAWHRVVETYTKGYPVLRMPQGTPERPEAGMLLLRYPSCRLEEIETVVAAGLIMPPGVTRFIVAGRYLNLRIPLDLLTSPAYDEADWNRFVQARLGALRFYAEGVYLCEG